MIVEVLGYVELHVEVTYVGEFVYGVLVVEYVEGVVYDG